MLLPGIAPEVAWRRDMLSDARGRPPELMYPHEVSGLYIRHEWRCWVIYRMAQTTPSPLAGRC